MGRASLVLRSLFLLGFVLAMPLLALPRVARWVDDFLYGESKPDSPHQEQAPHSDENADAVANVAQAVLETPLGESMDPPARVGKDRGLDAAITQPPTMPPTPDFPQSSFPEAQQTDVPRSPAANAEAATATERLGEIRQRLEDLGADYIVLKLVEETNQFHCQCRMIVAPGLAETETFQADGKDACAVAEQVLKSVEAWRANQASRSP